MSFQNLIKMEKDFKRKKIQIILGICKILMNDRKIIKMQKESMICSDFGTNEAWRRILDHSCWTVDPAAIELTCSMKAQQN